MPPVDFTSKLKVLKGSVESLYIISSGSSCENEIHMTSLNLLTIVDVPGSTNVTAVDFLMHP